MRRVTRSYGARSITRGLPPPIGGWNSRDNLDAMKAFDAITMENVFPASEDCRLRRGFSLQASGVGSSTVDTIVNYSLSDGTSQLLAFGGGKIYDASTVGAAATELATGFTNNQWQHVIFKNTLILCNGTDQPQQYDGTTVSAAAYTGIADDAVFRNVHVYKQRPYFIEKESTSVWYVTSAGGITGAVTEFDVGDVLQEGGSLSFIGSWSNDTGSGLEDLFVIGSSEGELLLYSGTNPSNFVLVSRLALGEPLGARATTNLRSDLMMITKDGLTPLSQVYSSLDRAGQYKLASDKIQTAFRKAATSYKDNFGWQAVHYPQGEYFLVNIPKSATKSDQYVMNSKTGAWCKFTGMNARSWCVYNDNIYFGGSGGNVYRADHNYTDNGNYIVCKIKWAFNYFKDRQRRKRFVFAKPIVFGDTSLNFTMGIDVDFGTKNLSSTISIIGNPGTPWDSPWDSPWGGAIKLRRTPHSLSGHGSCGALRMEGNIKNAPFTLSGAHIAYEEGGMF